MTNDITFDQWTESRVIGTHEWQWCGDGVGLQAQPFAPLTQADAAHAWTTYVRDWSSEAQEPIEYRIVTVRFEDGDSTVVDEIAVTDSTLMDADTDEPIGSATPAQIEASLAAGDTGIILIDADGDVIDDGTWAAQQPGVRRVWVAL